MGEHARGVEVLRAGDALTRREPDRRGGARVLGQGQGTPSRASAFVGSAATSLPRTVAITLRGSTLA
ncbi:hypothetical protein, partial [Actinacidiphila rubida]|uniref:hypothetical protein n=1 Tax=Actinacidiphila rubida TaxID=310780 RepID=UPI001C4020B7